MVLYLIFCLNYYEGISHHFVLTGTTGGTKGVKRRLEFLEMLHMSNLHQTSSKIFNIYGITIQKNIKHSLKNINIRDDRLLHDADCKFPQHHITFQNLHVRCLTPNLRCDAALTPLITDKHPDR